MLVLIVAIGIYPDININDLNSSFDVDKHLSQSLMIAKLLLAHL